VLAATTKNSVSTVTSKQVTTRKVLTMLYRQTEIGAEKILKTIVTLIGFLPLIRNHFIAADAYDDSCFGLLAELQFRL